MRRKCLDCPTLITTGSRCRVCQERYRSSYSRHGWAAAVKARAGGRCERCGATANLKAHHVRPLAAGGTDTPADGQCLCHTCHEREHHGEPTTKARR